MRSIVWLLPIALAACGSNDSSTADLAAFDDLATPDLAIVCSGSCGTCPAGATCVMEAGGPEPFAPSCLVPCTTDADCGARTCVDFPVTFPSGRYCLAADEPNTCGVHCDLVEASSRCSGSVLIASYRGAVCGLSYHQCASGCVEDAPDAGADRQAHCL
jgi:hypothetical protein